MRDKHTPDPGTLVSSPTDRLLRDLLTIGLLTEERPTACERLDTKLGHDLVAAIRTELRGPHAQGLSQGLSLSSRPRRVA
jgi:hypothetical protein